MDSMCGPRMVETLAGGSVGVQDGDAADGVLRDKTAAGEKEIVERFKNMSREEMDKWIKDYGNARMRQDRLSEIP